MNWPQPTSEIERGQKKVQTRALRYPESTGVFLDCGDDLRDERAKRIRQYS
jgi:hypothetical protein